MKLWQALLPVLFLNGISWAESLNLGPFRGLDTDNDPLFVKTGMAADARNILTDTNEGLGPRMGFVQFSTESGSGGPWVFPHSDGTRYLITQSSNVLKATEGGTNFTIILGTINTEVRTAGASLGDVFYWSSADGLKRWDTNSVTVTSPALNFDNLVVWKGRLAGSGVSGDKRTIYLSEYLNGNNWQLAVDPVDTDPARIQVQGSLDENVSGLYSSYRDMLMWFKANTFGGVLGSRRSNFKSIVFSQSVGSFYPDTVQDCDGELRFLGSRRAVWGFNGADVYKLTKAQEGLGGIDTLMNNLIQGESSNKSITHTTQDDFENGVTSGTLDIETSPGDIINSPQDHKIVPDDTFDDNEYDTNPTWTVRHGTYIATDGSLRAGTPYNTENSIYTPSTYSTGTWTFRGDFGDTPNSKYFYFMSSGTLYHVGGSYLIQIDASSISLVRMSVDGIPYVISGPSICSTSLLSMVSVTRTAEGVFLTSFTDLNVTEAPMLPAVDTTYTFSNYMIISYRGNGVWTSSITSIETSTLNYTHSSTFTSQTTSIGDSASQWGFFSANDARNGASIRYGIYADTNTSLDIKDPKTFVASQTIVSGEIPTIAISSYVTMTAEFTRVSTTQTATMYDSKINWVDGNPLRAASLWTNQRYWLGCSIGSPTVNNTVLVMDRNRQWQYWTGINMVGAVMYGGDPYFHNSGGVFKAEVNYDDNGAAIPSYFMTKSFYPSGPNYPTYLDALYLITSKNAETLNTSYYLDGKSTEFTLTDITMNSVTGYQDVKLPFADTSAEQGNTVQFKFAVTGTTNWRLLNANLIFDRDKNLHD